MSLITEQDGITDGYEAVELPSDPVSAAQPAGAFLRRTSARPTRRAVLYLHCRGDTFVPDDLASWYTERGFHFYAADMRAPGQPDRLAGRRHGSKARKACFAGLDAASAYLREAEGIDMLIVSAHGAGAVTAALWCHARRDGRPADALILSSPALGRRQRRPLAIACPVLVLVGNGESGGQTRAAARWWRGAVRCWRSVARWWRARRAGRAAVQLGRHVTWMRLDDQTSDGGGPGAADRRSFFDEMGRWLGAYMYGQVRDQLL
jgi:alpha-beta hydrolase superfamily lysophospholipase